MPTLSVILITRNEEANLADCLTSLEGIAQQIVVVDTNSTDSTLEIAKNHGAVIIVFTLLLSDFFDTVGTVTAIGTEAGLIDAEGNIPNNNKILFVDSIAAAAGGVGSISSNTSYIESASGVGEGARTGLASVVTGALFLLTTFLAPLVKVIPYEAATPALVIVGFLMMSQIKEVEWSDYGIGIPAFLSIILMPFTYNISVGIGAGFLSHVLVRVVQGRAKEVHTLLYVVSGLFVIYFLQSPINLWISK